MYSIKDFNILPKKNSSASLHKKREGGKESDLVSGGGGEVSQKRSADLAVALRDKSRLDLRFQPRCNITGWNERGQDGVENHAHKPRAL